MATFDASQANGTTLETIDALWAGNSTLINCQSGVFQVTATGGGTARVARYENGHGSTQSAQMDCLAGIAGTRRGVGTQNHATQVGYQTRMSGTNAVELRRNGTYVTEGAISGGNHTTTGYTIKITSNASSGRVQVWWATVGAADAEATGTQIIDSTDGSPLSTGYPSMEILATVLTTDASADNWTDFVSSGSDTPLTVDNGSGVGEGQNVSLLFDEAYVLPVTNGSATGEGQEIPFILTQPGSEGSAVGQGQDITLSAIAVLSVDSGSGVGAGQTITFNESFVLPVDSGSGVGSGFAIVLSAAGLPSISGQTTVCRRRGRR